MTSALHTDRAMSDAEAMMWRLEKDPHLSSTFANVTLLDRPPDFERLLRRLDRATYAFPRLRRRVQPVAGNLAPPLWADDPDFDLHHHVRRIALPKPGSMRQLLDLASLLACDPFDRTRPLWEFTLVEGLGEGRAAFVMKAHHVVTDGIGAVQLAVHLFDMADVPTQPVRPDPQEDPVVGAPEVRGLLGQVREVVAHDVEGMISFARKAVPSLVPSLLKAVRDPFHAVVDTVRTAESIGRTVAPVMHTLSPIMVDRHREGRFETFEVGLDDLRRAAGVAGGTLNDGFLAGITGGLRRYHEAFGAEVEDLRIAMPVSLRTTADDPGGNHVTVMRFLVPVGVEDPDERIRRLHDIGKRIRAEKSLGHTEAIAGVLNLMPNGVIGTMLKHVDFLASNVPGIPVPLELEG